MRWDEVLEECGSTTGSFTSLGGASGKPAWCSTAPASCCGELEQPRKDGNAPYGAKIILGSAACRRQLV